MELDAITRLRLPSVLLDRVDTEVLKRADAGIGSRDGASRSGVVRDALMLYLEREEDEGAPTDK